MIYLGGSFSVRLQHRFNGLTSKHFWIPHIRRKSSSERVGPQWVMSSQYGCLSTNVKQVVFREDAKINQGPLLSGEKCRSAHQDLDAFKARLCQSLWTDRCGFPPRPILWDCHGNTSVLLPWAMSIPSHLFSSLPISSLIISSQLVSPLLRSSPRTSSQVRTNIRSTAVSVLRFAGVAVSNQCVRFLPWFHDWSCNLQSRIPPRSPLQWIFPPYGSMIEGRWGNTNISTRKWVSVISYWVFRGWEVEMTLMLVNV